uniref:Phospholipase A2 group IVC n=1 Tax=Sarcophilus harrisii TaxID=9305 RepID=A0A7N4NLX5_SARHA
MTTPQQAACSVTSHSGKGDESSDISIHFGVSDEEKAAVKNRGEHVLRTLKKMGLNVEKGPVVSVLASGGGLRAAIACQGVLSELSHVGLLDLITYLAGVSGSTWCMSSLYTQSDMWQDLAKTENELRRRLREDSWKFSVALDGLCKAAERDDYSLTDFWSYSVVYYLTKELLDTRLSSVKHHFDPGTVPYPIFATIDHFLKSGGEENTLTLCGSVLADKDIVLKAIKDFFLKFICGLSTQQKKLISDPEGAVLKTLIEELFNLVYTFQTDGDYLPILRNLQAKMEGNTYFFEAETLTSHMIKFSYQRSRDQQRQLIKELLEKTLSQEMVEKSSVPSFLKFLWKTCKCFLSWTWGTTNNFLYKYEEIKDKPLTDHESMYLMDAGLAINSAYPLVLPPVRNSDIILSFDFSEGDPFETIKATKKYCKTCNIPFPPVDEAKLNQEAKAPSDFYIFEGKKTPVVLHFPLFNKVNCSSTEIIDQRRKTYETFHLTNYSDAEVSQLLEDSKANVRNNKDRILSKICEMALTVF